MKRSAPTKSVRWPWCIGPLGDRLGDHFAIKLNESSCHFIDELSVILGFNYRPDDGRWTFRQRVQIANRPNGSFCNCHPSGVSSYHPHAKPTFIFVFNAIRSQPFGYWLLNSTQNISRSLPFSVHRHHATLSKKFSLFCLGFYNNYTQKPDTVQSLASWSTTRNFSPSSYLFRCLANTVHPVNTQLLGA